MQEYGFLEILLFGEVFPPSSLTEISPPSPDAMIIRHVSKIGT